MLFSNWVKNCGLGGAGAPPSLPIDIPAHTHTYVHTLFPCMHGERERMKHLMFRYTYRNIMSHNKCLYCSLTLLPLAGTWCSPWTSMWSRTTPWSTSTTASTARTNLLCRGCGRRTRPWTASTRRIWRPFISSIPPISFALFTISSSLPLGNMFVNVLYVFDFVKASY